MHIRRWLDDPELRTLIGATAPMTEEDAGKWFECVDGDSSRMWYVIIADDDDSIIGEAGLLRLSPEWRTTDMTVIVGDEDRRGQGHGSEAGRLLLDLAFTFNIAVAIVVLLVPYPTGTACVP